MLKISVITIIKEVKNVHQKDIAMIKVGNFYRVYGKDAYIIANMFKYKVAEEEDIVVSGFPVKTLKRVQANLESKKINYLVLDRRDNYAINESVDFKNLNTYDKYYNISKIYINNQKRINNIYEYLVENSGKEELKELLKQIEECINAKGKI